MKHRAQSLIEFAVILLGVTIIAIISLQIISNKINSNVYKNEAEAEDITPNINSTEETNCTKMGLTWDKKNGQCSPDD